MWTLALVLLVGIAGVGLAASDDAPPTVAAGATTTTTIPHLSDGLSTDLPVTFVPDGAVVPPLPPQEVSP